MSSGRGVKLGGQEPRVGLTPRAKFSEGEDAAFLASSYGLTPDAWQRTVLDGWLGRRPDGKWAAPRCGVAVPRQNGKNGILEIRELFGMVELGERFLHTAHEVKTARKAFLRIASFFENERQYPELAALVKDIRKTNGQEAVVLTNGGQVEFIARSKGSGRGFTVDVLVMDEAQELNEDALAALLPTISASPTRNPQQIMTGTPPALNMDGAVWTRMRDAGVKGEDKRLAWYEWSVEGAVDLDDRSLWASTNPALGTRLNVETVADERAAMDDVTFARERLGMWASASQLQVIPAGAWEKCATQDAPKSGRVAFGIDMNPERSRAAIGVARENGDSVHVEVAELGPTESGSEWVVEWLVQRLKLRPVTVVVDGSSPAASLIPALKAARVPLTVTGASDMAKACGGFYDAAMTEGRLTHFDQAELNAALRGASKRNIAGEGAWGWNRKEHLGDITPLVAVTLAAYGMANARPAVSRAPRRIY